MRVRSFMNWTTAWLLSLPVVALAQQVAIGGYALPNYGSAVVGITPGTDSALWFCDYSGNAIGRMTTAGAITEYSMTYLRPWLITVGPDGAFWFTQPDEESIGRMTTAGQFSEYPLPPPPVGLSFPWQIITGPDGALWFTELVGNIGRITTAGVITEYPVPTPNSGPRGIAAGPDGALWFAEVGGNKIGRITTGGVISEYPLPTAGSQPYNIVAGPDGALWFTEWKSNKIGRVTTDGVVTEYGSLSEPSSTAITEGPDGALWFLEGYDKLGRITTEGTITEYPSPNLGYEPGAITTGPDGALWFTEILPSIGQAVLVSAGLSVSPASGTPQTKLTFMGSGFAGNESIVIYTSGVGSAVLANATADATGSFTAMVRAPQTPGLTRLFLSAGQSSGRVGAAEFTVRPRLALSPSSGSAGAKVTATGYGFAASEPVTIYWNRSRHNVLVNTGTNTNGALGPLNFTVPPAPPGQNVVAAVGVKDRAGAHFTVQ